MKKIQFYAKYIDETVLYWYHIKELFKSILQQHDALTIFLILSCAELHWPEFHTFLGNVNTDYLEFICKVVQHVHIIFCIFGTGFLLIGLRHFLNIGFTAYMGQNGIGIVLALEVLFIAIGFF